MTHFQSAEIGTPCQVLKRIFVCERWKKGEEPKGRGFEEEHGFRRSSSNYQRILMQFTPPPITNMSRF
jgi:hypothetical protein